MDITQQVHQPAQGQGALSRVRAAVEKPLPRLCISRHHVVRSRSRLRRGRQVRQFGRRDIDTSLDGVSSLSAGWHPSPVDPVPVPPVVALTLDLGQATRQVRPNGSLAQQPALSFHGAAIPDDARHLPDEVLCIARMVVQDLMQNLKLRGVELLDGEVGVQAVG